MGIFRTTKYYLAAPRILKALMIDNWTHLIVDSKPTTINTPLIYDVDTLFKMTSNRFFDKDIIVDTLDMLAENGDVNFKVKNNLNRYQGKIVIKDKGIKSYNEGYYSKLIILKWWKVLGLSAVVIFSIIKWGIPIILRRIT